MPTCAKKATAKRQRGSTVVSLMQYATMWAVINYAFDIENPSFNVAPLWKIPANTPPQHWKAYAYGEMELTSVFDLMKDMALTAKDVFLDVGSGCGKLVVEVALGTAVGKAIGIEIVKERHAAGLHGLARLLAIGVPGLADRVALVNDNVLNVDLSEVTVVYMANTVFGPELMTAILTLLATLPRLRRVVVTEKLCARHGDLCRRRDLACTVFEEVLTRACAVTWVTGKRINYTLYDRRPDATPAPAPACTS